MIDSVAPRKIRQSVSNLRLYVVHLLRVVMVAYLLFSVARPDTAPRDGLATPDLNVLIEMGHELDPAWSLSDRDAKSGLWKVKDQIGSPVGWVARSFPAAEGIIGYRGPTEVSVLLDRDLRIVSVRLLGSSDTEEHVDAVSRDETFFRQFVGWNWIDAPKSISIDGVSGATLTSFALTEGLIQRMGGSAPSLIFSAGLNLADAQRFYPQATRIDPESGGVFDADASEVGRLLRTGPLSDEVTGYQGPTELLLQLNDRNEIESLQLRGSFDNEPYVDYVRTEYGFWKIFKGMSLQQLSKFDPVAAGVEGVSGATMTSQAVAETLVAAAKEHQKLATKPLNDQRQNKGAVRWRWLELASFVVVMMAAVVQFGGVRQIKRIRWIWLILVVVVIGFWTGHFVSISLIAGWSAEGVAWRVAPGLALVAAAAFLFPMLTKQNLYCNHLCPHGAVQQLVKPSRHSPRRRRLNATVANWFRQVPGIVLVCAYVAIVLRPSIELSNWEPFHAYLFRIASWSSLVFAGLSLLVAAILPMAYCRFGCPTGRLLDYLRFNARSGSLKRADLVVLVLVLFATIAKLVD